ncbi:hypothetical protein FNU76_03010 [Chitinimonas arctica]|uniref:DUF4351 domain-containing protein n=1 Tax=Chitinimonas arctica TaxID=2594795 RepID=A0A516SB83_9NEIS|nr:hypothetical protein [Chitinimonas arctica]QDQ25407.1 hypothetical protein FNU76_03010 [Chitinimonas arctica]
MRKMGVLSHIFRVNNAENPEALIGILDDLMVCLAAPKEAALRRDVTTYIKLTIPDKFPQLKWSATELDAITDLQGLATMLANNVKRWTTDWILQGRKYGPANMLRHLLLRKYGRLPDSVDVRLARATSEQLLNWAEQLLSANHIDEVFLHQ